LLQARITTLRQFWSGEFENWPGPGKLTKNLGIDKSYYGEDLVFSDRIWVEDCGLSYEVKNGPRIGIEYAGEYWKSRPWRYYI